MSVPHTSIWKVPNWHQLSDLLVFRINIVCGFEEEDSLVNLRILSCFVRLESVLLNLLCVLVFFSSFFFLLQNAGSPLCFRFFFFSTFHVFTTDQKHFEESSLRHYSRMSARKAQDQSTIYHITRICLVHCSSTQQRGLEPVYISLGHTTQEPPPAACDNERGDLFYYAGLRGNLR